MQSLSRHDLDGHLQRLRRVFIRSFEISRRETAHEFLFQLKERVLPAANGPVYSYHLLKSASTEIAVNDRGEDDVCAILVERETGVRILCSFSESWLMILPKKNPKFRFNSAGITFFLGFERGPENFRKQIFRLEWDNCEGDSSGSAAFPHWNFDRWLTASEPRDTANELREKFQAPLEEERLFEPHKQQQVMPSERPSMAWFTRLHFPMIATCDPECLQPHRSVPQTPQQLEGWIEMALRYLKGEMKEFMSTIS